MPNPLLNTLTEDNSRAAREKMGAEPAQIPWGFERDPHDFTGEGVLAGSKASELRAVKGGVGHHKGEPAARTQIKLNNSCDKETGQVLLRCDRRTVPEAAGFAHF